MALGASSTTDMNISVDANVTGYERALERAQLATKRYEADLAQLDADMRKLQKSIDDHANAALKRHHDALDKTGKAALVFGAVVVAGFAMATNEAIKWESAWKGVTKTTNGSAEQMAALEQQLRDLTHVLPASHEEIAAVAEAAGQLGVRRDDIAGFTKIMIDLGQATNLSAEDAATAIAQFMNVMDSSADSVDHIGNTLVALGNKGASTEADIMHMAQRVVGAGKLIGLTEDQILGLSAAMANLGIQSQLGGGAMQRVLLVMESTVKSGGAGLDQLARFSGMSADRFASTWENKPIKALEAFVGGMNRSKSAGENLTKQLGEMGINGTQNLQVLLRLAGSGDMLTKSVDQASGAWEKNNALLKEVEKRYGTTASQIALARNDLVDASIDIGNMILPVLAKMVHTADNIIRAWDSLPGPIRTGIAALALLSAAIAIAGGAFMIAIPKVHAFNTALNGLEEGALKSAGNGVKGLAGFLSGPWGLAIGLGITALGIFAAKHAEAARQVQELRDTLDAQTGAITDNTRQWVIKALYDAGALQSAKDLGFNLGQVTEAALGNEAALAKIQDRIQKIRQDQADLYANDPSAGDAPGVSDLGHDLDVLNASLGDTNGTLAQSRSQWKLEHQAMGDAGNKADDLKGKQQGLNTVLQDGADAAGDLAGELQTMLQQMQDATSAFLDQRSAGRAVRDALRGISAEMKQYKKDHGDLVGAFRLGTEEGDKFQGMLDDLARDYQTQIDATARVTGSQKKTMDAYRQARADLIKTAEQMGRSKKVAEEYANTLLGTPAEVLTEIHQSGIGVAQDAVVTYQNMLDLIPREIRTHFIAVHDPTIGGNRPSQPSPPPKNPRGASGGGASTTSSSDRTPQLTPRWYESRRHVGAVGGSSGGGSSRTVIREVHVVERLASDVNLHVGDDQMRGYVENVSRGVSRVEIDDHHQWLQEIGGMS